jgi:hypothetical protein
MEVEISATLPEDAAQIVELYSVWFPVRYPEV